MKINLKKKVMLALLAGGMLCAKGAFADDVYWYGTPSGFVEEQPSPVVLTGVNLTVTDDLIVNGHDITVPSDIYGGYSGDGTSVTGNFITFNTTSAKTIQANVYAGWTASGNANNNVLTIEKGSFSNSDELKIHAGHTEDGSTANNNYLTINGGCFSSGTSGFVGIYGGWGRLNAEGNTLKITGGSFTSDTDIQAGYANNFSGASALVKENDIIITGGEFTGNITEIYAGHINNTYLYSAVSRFVKGNDIIITGGKFTCDETYIYAGYASCHQVRADVEENSIIISGGVFGTDTDIEGGYSNGSGTASSNMVEISGGVFGDDSYVYGGYSSNGDVGGVTEEEGNKVTVSNGVFGSGASIVGGYSNGSGMARNNIVEISGGVFGSESWICGGTSESGEASYNTVNITGGIFGDGVYLNGGWADTSTNNTLNLKIVIGGTAAEVAAFQKVNFTIPVGMDKEMPMIRMQDPASTTMALSGITFTTELNGLSLAEGEYITLVKGVDGTEGLLENHTNFYILSVGSWKELVYANNGVPVVKNDYTIKQGGVKGEPLLTGGSYTSICGNTDGSGLNVAGGSLSATSYSGNEIIIRRGTYDPTGSDAVAGAYNTTDDAISNNIVKIYDGTFKGNIYGGYSDSGEVSGNTVNIYGGTLEDIRVCGGYSDSGNANENKVNVEGGTFVETNIAGGYSSSESTNNHVIINNGTFENTNIYGGAGNGSGGTMANNTVEIYGGIFKGDISIYGSDYCDSSQNNEVTIAGGNFEQVGELFLDGGEAMTTMNGNKLNLKMKMSSKAFSVAYFQEINFTLPSDIQDEGNMLSTKYLKVDDGTGDDTATVNVYAADGVKLNKDDVITLVDSSDDTSGTFVGGDILGGAAMFYSERDESEDKNGDGDTNDLVITLLRDFEQKPPEP